MTNPLVVSDVWKSFGPVEAVKGLNLTVPAGSVYAFLGPNGAGKSTTIRMILGLQSPDKGTISVFGQPMNRHRTAVLRRIGSMVEAPSLYPHLTGRENLRIHSLLLDLPGSVIDPALDSVGLQSASNQLVRGYSSGMKQRLGLAQALLGNPDLLLLDEPTNALDPAGIHEVRELIRQLPSRSGTTVFVSSHVLAEVEQIATHVAIVAKGQRKFEGSTQHLRARRTPSLVIDVDNLHLAAQSLQCAGIQFTAGANRLRVVLHDAICPARINSLLVHAGVAVSQLVTEHPTLEQTFFELTETSTPAQNAEAGL